MAMLYAVGEALVSHDELVEKSSEVRDFGEKIASGAAASLEFTTGRATAENVITSVSMRSIAPEAATRERGDGGAAAIAEERNPFTPVGPGKPLAIEIRYVYTGEFPHTGFLGKKKDLLVTSAVKGLVSYEAAPRAVNFLRDGVPQHCGFATPAATEKGTPLVFYTPALTQTGTVATFDMVFDDFPSQVFEQIGQAMISAAAIPVFASKSVFLLGAGSLLRLAGKAGEAVFDAHPEFSTTESVTFQRPGGIDSVADFRVLTRDDAGARALMEYAVSPEGRMVHKRTGEGYEGPHPYIVISLDGREVKEYESFTPTAASAVLLDRFFGIREGKEQPADMLLDALKLYNDWKYRNKADALQAELASLDQSSDAYKKKKAEYDALVKNILSDVLKPKS